MRGRVALLGMLASGLSAAAYAAPGSTLEFRLEHRSHRLPNDELPSVIVHVPSGFDPTPPLHLVVFLHGWSCCARGLVGEIPCGPRDPNVRGFSLARLHEAAGTNSLLIVPQLAYYARDASAGRFGQRGFFADFLGELFVRLSDRLGRRGLGDIGSITLLAHSAGFATALAILDAGGPDVSHVVLFDALYAGEEAFASWVLGRSTRRLISVHTDGRSTTARSRRLVELLRPRLGPALAQNPRTLWTGLDQGRAVVTFTRANHPSVPRVFLAEALRALRLPIRPSAGPAAAP